MTLKDNPNVQRAAYEILQAMRTIDAQLDYLETIAGARKDIGLDEIEMFFYDEGDSLAERDTTPEDVTLFITEIIVGKED